MSSFSSSLTLGMQCNARIDFSKEKLSVPGHRDPEHEI